jgi:hypothetical protein
MVDALLTIQCASGIIECGLISETAADVTCDDRVTQADALLIAQKALGLVSSFPC